MPHAAAVADSADWRPADAETFIREVLPVARKGAARLGVQPAVLVAQAALETGWGQKMIRHPDGRNSFNLFGIKADGRWQGERATVATLEYEQGIARRERAAFRAYGSLEESVNDYVEFLTAIRAISKQLNHQEFCGFPARTKGCGVCDRSRLCRENPFDHGRQVIHPGYGAAAARRSGA